MKFEYFIAKRQVTFKDGSKNISSSLVNVAVLGIAVCIAIMIISIAILTGYKQEIRNKIIGFGSHIQIVNYDANSSYETNPIDKNQDFLPELQNLEGVLHVQQFATKAGIIKTENEIQGVVLKGVGSDFDWSFFKQNMVDGNSFQVVDSVRNNNVIISKYLSKLLKLKVGDSFAMYFVQDPPRMRKFTISGIYETSVEEMDKIIVLCDIGHIKKLNNWSDNQISGYEVTISDYEKMDEMSAKVNDKAGYSFNADGTALKVQSIKEKFPQIFDWLSLQDINVVIIFVIMLLVAAFNMISGLLIMILDRTNMIGILKAMGASNKKIKQIFILEGVYISLKGLFWGNVIGLGLCLIQLYTGVIKLDASTYYLDHVPIVLNVWYILVLNICTVILTYFILLLPSFIISKFSPAETIRYN